MAKGQQRSNKEVRKPKKDSGSAPPKPIGTTEPPRTLTTAIIPRGKLKKQ